MAAGLLPAALAALNISNLDVRERVLVMMSAFLMQLPDRHRPVALEELVTRKAVGLIVCIMGVGTEKGLTIGTGILALFLKDPQKQQRSSKGVFTENVASQIIRCFGRWLLKVCGVPVCCGRMSDHWT